MSEKLKKSKLPDLNECSAIASKFVKDLRRSVSEIVAEYKDKRTDDISESDK